MKIIAINGSPRKRNNSMELLQKWIDGVKSVASDADVEQINLYDLKYTGCRSCFACKVVGSKFYGTCPIRDDAHDLLAKIREADAVAIVAPIYFNDINAYTKCLLERMEFSVETYSGNILTKKAVDFTMLYSMNCTHEQAEKYRLFERLELEEYIIGMFYRLPARRVIAYNSYQMDYSKYESALVDIASKEKQRKEQFPKDLQSAFDTGASVACDINTGGRKAGDVKYEPQY